MGTIAKGQISLSAVSDACSVLITPASCVIKADFNGENPDLDGAKGKISITRGDKPLPFKVTNITTSSSRIVVNTFSLSDTEVAFEITSVDNTSLSGFVDFEIVSDDITHYAAIVRFQYTIIRESSMLDWIQDWEGSKTKVGGTYIMTPKIFIGKKDEIISEVNGQFEWKSGALTGVYIGPNLLQSNESSVGIYGYHKDREIFHINSDGGLMGGWSFNSDGLKSGNGVVNILAEGTIYAKSSTAASNFWGLYADGSASFANGKVKFNSDGSAEYSGKITSTSGSIGGWGIYQHQIANGRIILDSDKGFIGVNASTLSALNASTKEYIFPDSPHGGVKMWYTSGNDFGFAGWSSGNKVFQLGSTNFIAGWNFNNQAIWAGSTSPILTQGSYAEAEGALTIAPAGIRSCKWYIDANGTASYVGGKVKFDTENAEMFGWLMRSGRFSSQHAALVSASSATTNYSGLFVSTNDISEVSSESLLTTIMKNGGICVISNDTASIVRAYDKDGHLGFVLSTSGKNSIGKWNFNHEVIYTGIQTLAANGFADPKSIILGVNGLFGPAWKLHADGSGAIAGGNIAWDKDGKVTFSDKVSLSWNSITDGPNLTKIDAKGMYTGTISANNITAGTITTAAIQNAENWSLNLDGSGYLAARNITWDSNGALMVKGDITVKAIRYAQSKDYSLLEESLVEDAFVSVNRSQSCVLRLPHLLPGEYRAIRIMAFAYSRSRGSLTIKVDNSQDDIVFGTINPFLARYKTVTDQMLPNEGNGFFELIGQGAAFGHTNTIWYIIPSYEVQTTNVL